MSIGKLRLCLERVGVVTKEDHVALVIRVFWRQVSHTGVEGDGFIKLKIN